MTGGNVGLGALAGGIGGAIGGAVGFKTLKWDLPGRVAAQVISGSVSGGIASVIHGGNFWEGMAWGAAGAAIASGIGAVIEIATRTKEDHGAPGKAKEDVNIDSFGGRRLTQEEAELLREIFPNLNVDEVRVTGEATPHQGLTWEAHGPGEYNCFAWSCGVSDRWIEFHSVTAADAEYARLGYHVVSSREEARVALFANERGIQHAAIRKTGPWWESKLGHYVRIVHKLDQLEGGLYGNAFRFYGK